MNDDESVDDDGDGDRDAPFTLHDEDVEPGDAGDDVNADNDGLDAVQAPVKDLKLPQLKELVLRALTIKLTDDLDIATMLHRRDTFFNWLTRRRFNVLSNNRVIKEGFILEQATLITNVFFDQMMGAGGVSHLANLISYYTTHKKGKADNGLGMRAQELTTAGDTPLAI